MTLNNLYHQIIEQQSTATVVLDQFYMIEYLNPAAELLLMVSLNQAKSTPLKQLLPSQHQLFKRLERVQQSNQSVTERELKLFVPQQGELVVDCVIKLIELNGAMLFLLELFESDAIKRSQHNQNLQAQQQVLKGLAHEIKNPLGGLRGAAQLLQRDIKSATLQEYTQIIINETDRLSSLINTMLGSGHPSQKKAVNIHAVLQYVLTLVKAEVDKRIQFIYDYDPSLPEVFIDFDEMVQVFLNIANNAVQAMPERGKLVIRTRFQRNITINGDFYPAAVEVQIEDNGTGVPEALQETLFLPLVTGRTEGTGLGLYLSQALVSKNNGQLNFVSRPGKTIFFTLLPLGKKHD